MLKSFVRGAAALAMVGGYGTASAATMVATVNGTIGIVHNDSLFGAVANDAFKAVFTYDPAGGTQSPYNGGTEASTNGYVPNAPGISVSLTIRGITDNWVIYPGGSYYSNLTRSDYGTFSGIAVNWQGANSHYVNGQPTSSNDYQQGGFNVGIAGSHGIAFDGSFSGAATGGTAGFLRQVQNTGRGYDLAYWWTGSPTSITVQSAAVVPEADVWMMLIAGFGLVGAVARRRRPAVSAATA